MKKKKRCIHEYRVAILVTCKKCNKSWTGEMGEAMTYSQKCKYTTKGKSR